MRSLFKRKSRRRRKRLKPKVLRFSPKKSNKPQNFITTPSKVDSHETSTLRKPLKSRRYVRINKSNIDYDNHYYRPPTPTSVVSGPTPCQKRKVRRSVLFALGKNGSNPGRRKWDNSSFERCGK